MGESLIVSDWRLLSHLRACLIYETENELPFKCQARMSITESRYISVWLPKTLKGTGMVRSNFNFASGLLEVKLWLMKWQICNTLREDGGRKKKLQKKRSG